MSEHPVDISAPVFEGLLIDDIGCPNLARKDIAETYARVLISGEVVDWKRVNDAIVDRWSRSALVWIKEAAWKNLDLWRSAATSGSARGRFRTCIEASTCRPVSPNGGIGI